MLAPAANSDPQKAHLGTKVGSVPVVREEVRGVTGAARGQEWLLLLLLRRHHVVVDVGGLDSASLQKDSETGSANETSSCV